MIQKKNIVKDLTDFIGKYQESLWANDCRKTPDAFIPIITIADLIHKFKWNCSLHEFKDFISKKENEDVKTLVQEFVNNNFIHFACSAKLKELLIEYRESNVIIEKDQFVFDMSDIDTFNDIGSTHDHAISLNCDRNSDIEGKTKDKVLSTVEVFDKE